MCLLERELVLRIRNGPKSKFTGQARDVRARLQPRPGTSVGSLFMFLWRSAFHCILDRITGDHSDGLRLFFHFRLADFLVAAFLTLGHDLSPDM